MAMKQRPYIQLANRSLANSTEIFIALRWDSEGTPVHIFHEKPTFYFSPVDGHLCYGDFKTLGNIQELHIKSPVKREGSALKSCCNKNKKRFYCRFGKKTEVKSKVMGVEVRLFCYSVLKTVKS